MKKLMPMMKPKAKAVKSEGPYSSSKPSAEDLDVVIIKIDPSKLKSAEDAKDVPKTTDAEKKVPDEVIAVVVSVRELSSYDSLYEQIPQESSEGKISVYIVNIGTLKILQKSLLDPAVPLPDSVPEDRKALFKEMLKDIASVDPESVVFNWECCGGCSDAGFADSEFSLQFLKMSVEKKFASVFSDFSLKALIPTWTGASTEEIKGTLGVCPLMKAGEFTSSFKLRFNTEKLATCGNTQLEKVGELVGDGEADVHALSGTILYSVDLSKTDDASCPYDLSILSIMTEAGGAPCKGLLKLKDHKGLAGHVLFTYKSGGTILCSAGHWVELARLDTSIEKILNLAKKEYGDAYAAQLKTEYACASVEMQKDIVQRKAKMFVQSSAPVKYSSKSKYSG